MLILSNCLTEIFDEGCLKVANSLVNRIKKVSPETTVVTYERKSKISDFHLHLNKFLLSHRLFSLIKKCGKSVIYIPFPARTFATALRIFILSVFSTEKVTVVLTMKYKTGFFVCMLLRLSGAKFLVFSKDALDFYAKIVGNRRVVYLKTGVNIQKFVPVENEKKFELKQKYGFDPERPLILHVGHLNSGRNIAHLTELKKDYQVLLVTSTLTKNEQDAELKNKLLSCSNIRIIDDYIPNIEEIYQMSDLYFFPVVEEGRCIDVPLSCLEAAACNKPIVTTDYGEMKEFKNKNGFWFINSFDKNAINSLVAEALSGSDINTRSFVTEYDWNSSVGSILNLI